MTILNDDEFRSIRRSSALTQEQKDYWDSVETNDEYLADREKNPPRRGRAKNYAGNGVTDRRMSQTEVTLRIARHLCESPLLKGNVYVRIGGAEANRQGTDIAVFPVKSYLSRWGFTKGPSREGIRPRWMGIYSNRCPGRELFIYFDKHDPHIMAFFATGERLIVHCTAGNIGNTRSPAEHHDLYRTVGRAIFWSGGKPEDITAVGTPRSERFRTMTAVGRAAAGVKKAELRFFHVDRGGKMQGLQDEE